MGNHSGCLGVEVIDRRRADGGGMLDWVSRGGV